MKIIIACIGHLKRSPELELIQSYLKRFEGDVSIKEYEAKKGLKGGKLREEEGKLLLSNLPRDAYVVALDERGKSFSSLGFAEKLKDLQVQGTPQFAFLLGGADGHSDEVRQRANLLLSLGTFTWPHMLARVMIVEQLYRAQQIMKGHPYHRE